MTCKTALPLGAHAADNVARAIYQRPEQRFGFGDTGSCISLGRHDGIIQTARRDGTPTTTVFTGRLGAWLKERVCRFTVAMLACRENDLVERIAGAALPCSAQQWLVGGARI